MPTADVKTSNTRENSFFASWWYGMKPELKGSMDHLLNILK